MVLSLPCYLTHLPEEITIHIALYLRVPDVLSWKQVSCLSRVPAQSIDNRPDMQVLSRSARIEVLVAATDVHSAVSLEFHQSFGYKQALC